MVGLIGALELVPSKTDLTKRFDKVGHVGTIARDHSFSNGMVMRAVRDSLIISPPLVLGEEEAVHLVKTAKKTLDDTWASLKTEGLI